VLSFGHAWRSRPLKGLSPDRHARRLVEGDEDMGRAAGRIIGCQIEESAAMIQPKFWDGGRSAGSQSPCALPRNRGAWRLCTDSQHPLRDRKPGAGGSIAHRTAELTVGHQLQYPHASTSILIRTDSPKKLPDYQLLILTEPEQPARMFTVSGDPARRRPPGDGFGEEVVHSEQHFRVVTP
jgi:hypothetical protein